MHRMSTKFNVLCIFNTQLINVKLSGNIYLIHRVTGLIKVSALLSVRNSLKIMYLN